MRFLTAGESHGPALTVIIDDFPAGVPITADAINRQLARRQEGYGRSARQKIETDRVQILGGIRHGKTTGAPITLLIENKDAKNWQDIMSPEEPVHPEQDPKRFTRPRPGHADLAGYYKYGHQDLRDVLERSSARETAARVAAGTVARCLLEALGIDLSSHVTAIGGVTIPEESLIKDSPADFETLRTQADNDLHCAGSEATRQKMKDAIDAAQQAGTTLGGEFEVIAWHVPPGLGSYAQWDRRLDGQLAQALMSIQAVKAVSIGDALSGKDLPGHEFHDPIQPGAEPNTLTRPSNRAGGLEGGVTNGMPLILRAVMKPISTMRTPLNSINLDTGKPEKAHFERSDVTAVPACAVIGEAMVAYILAQALLDKFGHDTLEDIQAAYALYQKRLNPIPV